uniref:PIPK domain-containing protein n=1 Tax=Globisporangium ultimum (strain ATCC 200006 / CBS 805.95 / DAOM BR144) TaxID=431595 RepID=K3WJV1_GLOUD
MAAHVCTPAASSNSAAAISSIHGDADTTEGYFGRRLGAMSSNGTALAYLEPEFSGVETVKLVASLVSFLGCVFIITTYFFFPPLRQHHSTFIVWIALMGLFFHGTVIVQAQVRYATCCTTASIIQLSLLSQELYLFVLACNFYFTTKYPFRKTKWFSSVYHCAVWVVSGVTAYMAASYGTGSISSYGYCWYSFRGDNAESLLLKTFFLPVCAGYCISLTLYILATKRVRLSAGGPLDGGAQTNLDSMRSFLFVSFAYWWLVSIPYVLRHRGVVEVNSTPDKSLRFIGRILLALKGTLVAITWARATRMNHAYRLWKQGNWDDYLKVYEATWVLRHEILYFATQGIQKSAELTGGRTEAEEVEAQAESIFSFAQMAGVYPWQLRLGVLSEQPNVISFELDGLSNDQTVTFRDFEPDAFREIRQLSGISTETYIQSFAGRTRERFSMGKSGSFLYYTGDQFFILKTCTPGEQRYLLQILPQYTDHLKKNPNSYLCRYVGCHELVMAHQSVHFIVLTNILNNSTVNVDEFYDLKGSWVGRYQLLARDGTQRVCKFCGRDFIVGMSKEVCEQNPNYGMGHAEFIVGKDLNWSYRKLGLPEDVADRLGAQLYADSEFLQRMNSMDYSLVIGLNRRHIYASSSSSTATSGMRTMRLDGSSSGRSTKADKGSSRLDESSAYLQALSPHSSRAGNELLPTGACVVNMGIIDILTPWSLKKSFENWIRVRLQCQDPTGVSCIRPALYADRFRRNVVDTVIFGNPGHCSRSSDQRKDKEFIMVDFSGAITLQA